MKLTQMLVLVSLAWACAAGDALAQRTPPIDSPIVHPDRTVTFRYKAPGARKVELSAQFQKENQPLTMDASGVWSVTIGPIEPDLYPHNLVVDCSGLASGAMTSSTSERRRSTRS